MLRVRPLPKEREIRMHRQRGYNEVELANREWEREEKKQTQRDTNGVRERERDNARGPNRERFRVRK